MKQLAPVLTVVAAALLLGTGCVQEDCGACSTRPHFDLVVTESANGGTGVVESTGAVAFALDARRVRLTVAEPTLGKVERPTATDLAGSHTFVYAPQGRSLGAVTINAGGAGLAPFTYRLVIADVVLVNDAVARPGQIVGETIANPPPPGPAWDAAGLEVVADWTGPSLMGDVVSPQPRMPWRALRAAKLGTFPISPLQGAHLVVVDPPPAYGLILAGPPQPPVFLEEGQRFMLVVVGDNQAVNVSSSHPDVLERLPNTETGPDVPGATLIPLRMRFGIPTEVSLSGPSGPLYAVPFEVVDTCVPQDFPRYPGAVLFPGDRSTTPCMATWLMRDDPGHVLKTYRPLLDQGDWQVRGVRGTEIDIARRSRPAVRGTVQATASDRGTLIQVRLQD